MKQLGFGRRNNAKVEQGAPVTVGRRQLVSAAPQIIAETPEAAALSASVTDQLYELLAPTVADFLPAAEGRQKGRAELARLWEEKIRDAAQELGVDCSDGSTRECVTALLNDYIELIGGLEADIAASAVKTQREAESNAASIEAAKFKIHPLLMQHIDASTMADMSRGEVAEQISDIVSELLLQQKIHLNQIEQQSLVTLILNDMLGLGPLEPLLADDAVTDIMVNGPKHIYVERKGKLTLSDAQFRDEQHLMNVAQRIVGAVGRRVDESSPICDARLLDGSRVNVIIPPLAIDGSSISIRKFAKRKITLDMMAEQGNMSDKMSKLLQIAGRCRLNIVISGGTGSGKTTMLNAISRTIDPGERVVTIEDAAELQLQQPHVVRLETRPPNLEGQGEITMRDLVKNALRMRPDRIILGEVRGPEAVDLLQAMNTGHDGSLGTLHANRPREALTRLENMVNMAGLNLPPKAIRAQISDAVHMIVQVSRMRDGVRRVTYITEIVGMEGDIITTQDLFTFQFSGEDDSGRLIGTFDSAGLRPAFLTRAEYFGLGRALMECI